MKTAIGQIDGMLNFSEFTGKNVSVAVIDSGIVPPDGRDFAVREGIRFYKDSYGALHSDDRMEDAIGHGTACAGIIAKKAPNAAIFPIRIFGNALETDLDLFEAAVEWCRAHTIRVLNVSLGTTSGTSIDRLKRICRRVYEDGMILVAAENNQRHKSYPATFPFVLGVTAGKIRSKYGYHYRADQAVEIVARGDNQRLHWTDPKFVFLGGNSFAAPHVTAIVCLILEALPQADFDKIKTILALNAIPGAPVLVDANKLYAVDRLIRQKRLKDNPDLEDFQLTPRLNWIRRAVIFPYSKEMHALIRYRDLLPFEIAAVVDIPGRMTLGKDAGRLIDLPSARLTVTSEFDRAASMADTVILGYLDELSAIRRRNLLQECCAKAVEQGCHVFSFLPLSVREYREIHNGAKGKNLQITSPLVTFDDFRNIIETGQDTTGITTPVLGIFGTGPSQGKLTTQLCLRRWLQAVGYNVAQIGTEHHGTLFGFDFSLPIGYGREQSVHISTDKYIPLLQAVVRILDARKPDIILAGAQSGVIPHDFNTYSDCYTLPTLAFLFGIRPDAYVLVVNSIDSLEYIQDTIHVLQSLGKSKVIALVFGDMKKEFRSGFGRDIMICEKLTHAEIEETVLRLENRFGVPATEIISQQGQLKLVNAVIDYFAEADTSVAEPSKMEI
ncbi:MAG: S8 family serine peptidase [Deltaproteobacteria bacterium]|nr:S8 family serine peptidase [Deltaproteobacteria bacterium]